MDPSDPDPWAAVGAGGLGLPDPPAALARRIAQLRENRWGTRRSTPSLRGLAFFEDEFLAGPQPRDYVLASREDVATNEGSIQYALVYGRLGIFLIVDSGERGRRLLDTAAEFQERALLALGDGPLHGDGKLSLVHSDFSEQHWRWTGPDATAGIDGLSGAVDWLGQRTRSAG